MCTVFKTTNPSHMTTPMRNEKTHTVSHTYTYIYMHQKLILAKEFRNSKMIKSTCLRD